MQCVNSFAPGVKLFKPGLVVLGIRIHVKILPGGDLGPKSNQIIFHPLPLLHRGIVLYKKAQICLESSVFSVLVSQVRALLMVIDDLL